jgi:hypothetical protein
MARGTQFLQLVTMLREELGRATDVSVGVSDVPELKRKLNRYYEQIYTDRDWPHLRRTFDRITLSAGERFYDLPEELDYERIERVVLWQNGIPIPLDRGITSEDYAGYDSVSDERSSPVLKWDIRDVAGDPMVELWPMPSDNTQKIEFTGFVKFTRLVNDSDICLLDDNLVVGFAAAELLAKQESKNAKQVAEATAALYDRLTGRVKAAKGTSANFASPPATAMTPARVTVRVSG